MQCSELGELVSLPGKKEVIKICHSYLSNSLLNSKTLVRLSNPAICVVLGIARYDAILKNLTMYA